MQQLLEFFRLLFSGSGYEPRLRCGEWPTAMLYTYIVSDITIALAFARISATVVSNYHRFGQISSPLKTDRKFGAFVFSTFIGLAGCCMLLNAIIFYYALYRLQTLVLLMTAISSVVAACVMPSLTRRISERQGTIEQAEQTARQAEVDMASLKRELMETQALMRQLVEAKSFASDLSAHGAVELDGPPGDKGPPT